MNTNFIITAVTIVLAALITIAVDAHQSRSHRYTTYLVVLRLNNEYVRNIIQKSGIKLCWCTRAEAQSPYLFTTEGEKVCAFNESRDFLLHDAKSKNQIVIDCGINTKLFIAEVKKLQKQYSV